jgi:DNA-binding response OmpR family regulator
MSRRILLVEDEYLVADLVAAFLDELGYAVLGPAYGADDASKLAAGETFDGALLDWNLDTRGSASVADILINRDVPFIFVTGYDAIPDGQYRNIPILRKPFDLEALAGALEKTLRRRSPS